MGSKEILDFFFKRRSVRRFQKKAIPEEILDVLMQAAMAAPSGNNFQPWEFVIVRDPRIKADLSRVHPWVSMAAEAPAAIVVLGDTNSEWWEHDCSAAVENLLLAAANLSLGTVWCGMRENHAQTIRKILGVPAKMGVLAIVPIGYPAENPSPQTKYRAAKVHHDHYGNKA
jgi:nitroreductase